MMYEKYAELTRRMDAATATQKTVKGEFDAAFTAREILTSNDFEIGTHAVSGGEVIVSVAYGTRKIKLIEIDEKTQEFAGYYATHCRSVDNARECVDKARASRIRITDARDAYWRRYRDRLVDGTYTVEGGTVTITDLGAAYSANS